MTTQEWIEQQLALAEMAKQPEPVPEEGRCELCGELMPIGEEMFRYHGYSGKCPSPMLPKSIHAREKLAEEAIEGYPKALRMLQKVLRLCDRPYTAVYDLVGDIRDVIEEAQ